MSEFIIGFVCGLSVMFGICGVIYVPTLNKLRDEICKLNIDLMNK